MKRNIIARAKNIKRIEYVDPIDELADRFIEGMELVAMAYMFKMYRDGTLMKMIQDTKTKKKTKKKQN